MPESDESKMPIPEPRNPSAVNISDVKSSALIGALSGLTVALMSLVTSPEIWSSLAFASAGLLVGLVVRFVVLAALGALGAALNLQSGREQSFVSTFQLGMVLPLIVQNVILQTAVSANSEVRRVASDGLWSAAYKIFVVADASPGQFARGAGVPLSGDAFTLVFTCLMGLTLFSAIISVYLGTKGDSSQRMNSLIETYSTTWKMGFGALVGLLSGKAFS
jgi:hypothetical protein